MKEISMKNLESCFAKAINTGSQFVAVLVRMESLPQPEIIVNPAENIKAKLEYYKNAYNDDLTLKSYNRIHISDFAYGNSLDEIKTKLAGGK